MLFSYTLSSHLRLYIIIDFIDQKQHKSHKYLENHLYISYLIPTFDIFFLSLLGFSLNSN